MKEFLEKLDEGKVKTGIRIAALVVIACFFFPFFTVSCNMQTIEVTGADIAKGMNDYVSPHPVVYSILVLAGIVLGTTFVARVKPWRKLIGLICSAAGLVLMAVIHSGFVDTMKELGASAEEIAEYTETEFGFWGCVLGYLAVGVFSWLYGRYMVAELDPAATGVASQPVVSQPVVSQPVVSQPVVSQPVVNQPVASRSVVSTPIRNSRVQPTQKKKTCPCCKHTQAASKPECEGCGYRFIVV